MEGNSAALIVILLLVSSCGRMSEQLFSAPSSQKNAGLIASCTTVTQAKSLAAKLGIQYRIINKKRRIIEFVGATKTELAKHLPKSRFTQNKVFTKKLISSKFQATTQNVQNTEFFGAHTPEYAGPTTATYFPHLTQISALGTHGQGAGVIIAVIDTGVYYNHPHLSPNILTNPADKHGGNANGSDDDGNGYADDYVGWDFYNGDAYPIDDNGHGTHVSGLAASTYMGVAPRAKILPIKVLSADGQGDLGTIAAGILYAIDRGADIINLSLGGPAASEASAEIQGLLSSIKMAATKNALVIAAAGNGGSDGIGDCNDALPTYPASLSAANIISVASVDSYNQLTSYSNFGAGTVHVAAPGGDYINGGLLSTDIPYCYGPCTQSDTQYSRKMGTSMATPIVSGLAAVVMSENRSASYAKIKSAIERSGEVEENLAGKVLSGKVVNLANTLNSLN